MKKYTTKKMFVVSRIADLSDSDERIDCKIITCLVTQKLMNKVFRAKKRFKNKYDSKANKVHIYKGKAIPMSKTVKNITKKH